MRFSTLTSESLSALSRAGRDDVERTLMFSLSAVARHRLPRDDFRTRWDLSVLVFQSTLPALLLWRHCTLVAGQFRAGSADTVLGLGRKCLPKKGTLRLRMLE